MQSHYVTDMLYLACVRAVPASQPSVSVARSRCTGVCECAMAGGGGVDEWLRAVLVVLCAVNILGQVTHVDPVGYTSREGTVCYDNGRPQVVFCMLLYVMYCLDKRHCCTLLNPFNLYAPHFRYIGQAFRYSPENAFYIFNQQIHFIIRYLLDRASLI